MKAILDALEGIDGVVTQALSLKTPFVEMAARFAHEPGCVVLLSGGDLDCARYHILGLRPWLGLRGRLHETDVFFQGSTHRVPKPPLDLLEDVLARCRVKIADATAPVAAGLFGYLAYDLKDSLERLPRTSVDDLTLPHLVLFAPTLVVVHDKVTRTTRLHAPMLRGSGAGEAASAVRGFLQELARPPRATGGFAGRDNGFRSNVSRSGHMDAVQRIRDYIAAGDVYQVNLSQRFDMGFDGDGFSLFRTLYEMNPAPFFAYVNAGDHQIVSTSPERFLQRTRRRVETRPIKGTRPRGSTPKKDRELRSALAESPKDDAELSMIVDLLRNDIGKVCTGGSVVVSHHKRLEAYQNVYHLVSVVEGTLAEGKGSVDLIRATFPGGSITGCPKIRAMEIIDELESCRRHVYTGSIGYISFHDTLDLSIAIRTATIVDDRIYFSVGGGIVYDSDPEEEYAETLHKGRTLMTAFGRPEAGREEIIAAEPWVWMNGRMTPQSEARLPIADLGLQYGFGFFETIRVEKGVACRLSDHLERFNRTWAALFSLPGPDLTWQEVIAQVIGKNGLAETTAAVKLIATRGDPAERRFNGSLVVTARSYTHRLATLNAEGLTLMTYPHPRTSPLADFKTLNYLYYQQAGAWAERHGAHEALILNPDGSVSETNTANLLVLSGRRVLRPRSSHVLPGVMQAAVCRDLAARGFTVEEHILHPEALPEADTVLLTNSLMGAVAALSLDGRRLNIDASLVESLENGAAAGGGGLTRVK